MNIKDEITKNDVVLLVIPNENYNNILINTIKKIGSKDNICYVTLSKGYDALTIALKKNKINTNKFFFVDSITKTVKTAKDTNNCVFVSSPNSLTELSLAITKAVKKQKSKFVIFDSLSTLRIYHKDNMISKFVQGLINKFGTTESNLVFAITKKDKESELFKNMQVFVNKVIEL